MKEAFLKRMKEYLQDEYDDYLKTLEKAPFRGLSVNTLKVKDKAILEEPFKLSPSLFYKDGYYVLDEISGQHPFHQAGLFYLQEPSASSVVSVMDIQEGDWVLDLCAAPGGKSAQIASMLNHTGLLVSNEIVFKRAMILLSNMERMGVSENIVTNSPVEVICQEMQGCFDKVLVDAPCSGEGMFKIHEDALNDWSLAHVQACAKRQLSILDEAYHALKQNGILVYSTCTYAMEENELCMMQFLKKHEDMELVPIEVDFGRPGFMIEGFDGTKCRRIFPMDQGEGHFICKMKRTSENQIAKLKTLKSMPSNPFVQAFLKDQLAQSLPYFYEKQNKIYMKDSPFIELKKTNILRQGIECGQIEKNRFEPHQHFYSSAILQDALKHKVEVGETEILRFMQGNVIDLPTRKGYVALTYHDYVVGFGKSDGKIIKNKYPKGLRIH